MKAQLHPLSRIAKIQKRLQKERKHKTKQKIEIKVFNVLSERKAFRNYKRNVKSTVYIKTSEEVSQI